MQKSDNNQPPPAYGEMPPPAYSGPPGQGNPSGQFYPQPPPYPDTTAYPQPNQPAAYAPSQMQTSTNVVTSPTTVLVSGNNCSACGIGYIREDYSTVGIVLAILFFPWGLICCLMMKERRCSHCGIMYD